MKKHTRPFREIYKKLSLHSHAPPTGGTTGVGLEKLSYNVRRTFLIFFSFEDESLYSDFFFFFFFCDGKENIVNMSNPVFPLKLDRVI